MVGSSLQRLSTKGIVEQDIIELANLLERSNGTDMNELQKYGRIKFTIQQLEQQIYKLRNQINELQRQKQVLDEQNQKMLSVLAYSDPVVKFLQGSDDDLNKSFVRLSRAFAAGGEEAVSIPESKMAVAKALSVLIAKLDPNKLQAKIGIALDVIRYCITMGSELPTNSKLEGMSPCTAVKHD